MTEDLHPLKGQESRRAQRLLNATRLWIELLLVVSLLCRSDAFSLNTLSSSTKWKNLPAVKKLENGRNILKRSLPLLNEDIAVWNKDKEVRFVFWSSY
jgi:hypothetical protein